MDTFSSGSSCGPPYEGVCLTVVSILRQLTVLCSYILYRGKCFNSGHMKTKQLQRVIRRKGQATKIHLREDWHVKFFVFQLFLFSSQNINYVQHL